MHTPLRAGAAAMVAVSLLTLALVVGASAAGAVTAQFPPATTVPPAFPTDTTLAPVTPPTTGVLVPDTTPTTTGATSATVSPVTEVDQDSDADTGDPAAERTVWIAIAGLGAVALLILILTVIYARHTRPDRWHGGQDDWVVPDSPDEVFAPTAARSVFEHENDEQGFWWAED